MTLPATKFPAPSVNEAMTVPTAWLEQEFARLLEEWRVGRGTTSNMTRILMHPAYQRIIGMGPAVLPCILREMQRTPDHWHWALRSITGENPVPQEHAGNVVAMSEDWRNWAVAKGYER